MSIALITGASSGLGVELARCFAADRHEVVLVARRQDRLAAVGAELTRTHGVAHHVVPADLGAPGGWQAVADEVARRGLAVEHLVNNAGFGGSGPFAERDPARDVEMVQVNVIALMGLTRALLPAMLSRGHGRILNVGSTAGFQPGPFMATYYASKAFVNSFTEALWYELRGSGVTATVSCPGATATEFTAVAGTERSRLFAMGAMSAAVVARQAYRAMMAGRPMVVHGFRNRVSAQGVRFLPRGTVRALAAAANLPLKEPKALR